jgi:hypothetical protein
MEALMNNAICLALTALAVIAFTAVNLFLPYALLAAGAFIGLGFACGIIKRRKRSAQCPLGFC